MLTANSSNSRFTNNIAASANRANGFSAQVVPAVKKIIRKKSPVSFQRRFLSEKCTDGIGQLEVAMLWRGDVVRVESYNNINCNITIGNRTAGKDKVTFGVEDSRIGSCKTLLSCINNKWFLNFERNYDGFIVGDASRFGAEKMMFANCEPNVKTGISVSVNNNNALSVQIDGLTRAAVKFGDVLILVRLAKPASIVPATGYNFNRSVLSSIAMSFLIHFSVFATVLFATDRVSALNIDRVLTSSRFAQALIMPVEEEEQEVETDEVEEPEIEVADNDAISDVAPSVPTVQSNRGGGESGGSMGHSAAVAAAKNVGLLANSNAMNSMLAMASNIDSLGVDYSNFDAAAANALGNGCGSFCMMATSGMLVGDGNGFTTDGFSNGRGNGFATRAHNAGNLSSGEKVRAVPGVKPGKVDVSGSLDARQIQKVVRQHTGEIRACYEKELLKEKGLSGKITMNWFIDQNGSVTKVFVKESTMHNKNVESCIKGSIEHWRFPSPKGGSMSSIIYPFTFTAGSQN